MTPQSEVSVAIPPVELTRDATFKVIGLGGVGSIVARYASMYLASLNSPCRLVLIDGDSFEPSNSSRMIFSACGNKASVVRDDLVDRFEESQLSLEAIEQYVTPKNAGRLIREGDVIVLTVDNHATRRLIDDTCTGLRDVTVISGGNDGVGPDASGRVLRGTYGNCQAYLRRNGEDLSPSLGRFHPEIASPADTLPSDAGCAELVASVPQILFANLMTASAICNTLWLHLLGGAALHYSELAFDIYEGLMKPAGLPAPQLAR